MANSKELSAHLILADAFPASTKDISPKISPLARRASSRSVVCPSTIMENNTAKLPLSKKYKASTGWSCRISTVPAGASKSLPRVTIQSISLSLRTVTLWNIKN